MWYNDAETLFDSGVVMVKEKLSYGVKAGCVIMAVCCVLLAVAGSINGDLTAAIPMTALTAALFSSLILIVPSWLCLIPVVLPAITVVSITHQIIPTLLSTAFVFSGAFCAAAVMRGQGKSVATVHAAAPVGGVILLALLFSVGTTQGEVSGNSILAFFDEFAETFVGELSSLGEDAEMIKELLRAAAPSLLGMIAAFVVAGGYFTASLTRCVCKWSGVKTPFPDGKWIFEPSKVSAVVYLMSVCAIYLITSNSTADNSAAMMVTYTFFFPLYFAMTVVGLGRVFSVFSSSRPPVFILVISVIVAILMIQVMISILYVVSIFGAFSVIVRRKRV